MTPIPQPQNQRLNNHRVTSEYDPYILDDEFNKTQHPKPSDITVSTKILRGFNVQEVQEQSLPLPELETAGRPWRAALTIVEADIQIVFDITNSIVLGRSYPSTELFKGVDLSPFNAYELGVSREHAVLLLQESQVILRDNESSNGTLLNNKRLKANVKYVLQSGDLLNLAKMALRFDLLYNPFDRS